MTEPQDSTTTTFVTECKGCGCPLHSSTTTGVCSETCAREVAHLARARYLGADAALTSSIDHYMMSAHEARAYLSPDASDDGFPPPELVEWQIDCGESFASMLGVDALTAEHTNAWHEGVNMVWEVALQATALRVLGDVVRAMEHEAANEVTVASLRTAAGL